MAPQSHVLQTPFLKSQRGSSTAGPRLVAHEVWCFAKLKDCLSVLPLLLPCAAKIMLARVASLFALGLSAHSGRSTVKVKIVSSGLKGSGLGGRGGSSVMVPSGRGPRISPHHRSASMSHASFLFTPAFVPSSLAVLGAIPEALPPSSLAVLEAVSCIRAKASATLVLPAHLPR